GSRRARARSLPGPELGTRSATRSREIRVPRSTAAAFAPARLELLAENRVPVDVLQAHGHNGRPGVDVDLAEELIAGERRRVCRRRRLLKNDLWPERVVQAVWPEAARVQRAGDELPERREVREPGASRIVVVCGAVMHVGGEPDDVIDARPLDEPQELGDLELSAESRAVAVCGVLEPRPVLVVDAVADLETD